MNRIKYLIAVVIAAFAVTACEPAASTTANNAAAKDANAVANSNANAAAGAPTKEQLMTLDRSAFEAWKNKDAEFWETYISDKFAGVGGPAGRMDKPAVLKHFAANECEVKSYSLTDEAVTPLGTNAALLTYKATADATCGGTREPANAWVATVFDREGTGWKAIFHGESPIPDPNAKPATAKTASEPAATTAASPAAAPADPAVDSLLALEKTAWEAWKNQDAKALADWAGTNLTAFTSNGRENAAGAVKTWTTGGCQIRSVTLSQPSTLSLGPDHTIVFFKSVAEGTCGGQPTPPEYGATIYAKDGTTQKPVFSMGSPIM